MDHRRGHGGGGGVHHPFVRLPLRSVRFHRLRILACIPQPQSGRLKSWCHRDSPRSPLVYPQPQSCCGRRGRVHPRRHGLRDHHVHLHRGHHVHLHRGHHVHLHRGHLLGTQSGELRHRHVILQHLQHAQRAL